MKETTIETTMTEKPRSDTTVTIGGLSNGGVEATKYQTTGYFIYYILGVLEVLLAFRLILKLTGASTQSGFVGLIYGLTGVFILPFQGMFRNGVAQGAETTSVFEPATIVAIIVYAAIAVGLVKLVRVLSKEQQE